MLIFDIVDFTQNVSKVFDKALTDEVIIKNNNGKDYKLLPINNDVPNGKSPLEDIPFIKVDITTQEIVDIIRECRAGL